MMMMVVLVEFCLLFLNHLSTAIFKNAYYMCQMSLHTDVKIGTSDVKPLPRMFNHLT